MKIQLFCAVVIVALASLASLFLLNESERSPQPRELDSVPGSGTGRGIESTADPVSQAAPGSDSSPGTDGAGLEADLPAAAVDDEALGGLVEDPFESIPMQSGDSGLGSFEIVGDGFVIDKHVSVERVKDDGTVEMITYERNFDRISTRIVDGAPVTMRSHQVPIQMAGESKVVRSFAEEGRRGQYKVKLSLYPNVQENPEGGTLINVDGIYFGFRVLDAEQRDFELVSLSLDEVDDRGELKWDPILAMGSYQFQDPLVKEIVQEQRDLQGVGGAEWERVEVELALDYESATWRLEGGAGDFFPGAMPLYFSDEIPKVEVSNGFDGETLVTGALIQKQASAEDSTR